MHHRSSDTLPCFGSITEHSPNQKLRFGAEAGSYSDTGTAPTLPLVEVCRKVISI